MLATLATAMTISFLDAVLAKGKEYWKVYGQPLLDWAGEGDNPTILIGLAAAVVVFWWLPRFLIKRQIARGNLRASIHQRRVKRLGLVGYLIYLAGGLSGRKKRDVNVLGTAGTPKPRKTKARKTLSKKVSPKSGRKACPECTLAIDRLVDYAENLEFGKCPHCGAVIEPCITFEAYISVLVGEMAEEVERRKRKKKRSEEDITASKGMNDLLRAMYAMAVRYRATDIHIERDASGAKVHFRVDGMLSDAFRTPAILAPALLSSIKVQANLDITNHTTPQDGRYQIEVNGVEFDVRISCAPTSSQGEILFSRLLDKRTIQIKPHALGFEGRNLEYFEAAISKPHGLILVTGPTGSGKSTTLYVAMTQINTGERNIVTIEDPVEYQLPGLKQMQVNPDKNFSFATGLRSILRQDPDVILVGEIRDHETANMAIDAAATGHLVFTTLHTMDTATAVSRLSDLGVSSKRYASALEIIIAQRLIRLICNGCKQQSAPTDEELQRLSILKYRSSIRFMAGIGCHACNFSGYFGRRAILEVLKPDDEMRGLLEHETRAQILRDHARRKGMRLLREEGILKAIAGKTTIEEIIRTTC
jgi:type II secretory ATPase GspE/PulE/Tfp pilus assembly ATPase PilB-like protein